MCQELGNERCSEQNKRGPCPLVEGEEWSTGKRTDTQYCLSKAGDGMLREYMARTSNPDLGGLARLSIPRSDTELETLQTTS